MYFSLLILAIVMLVTYCVISIIKLHRTIIQIPGPTGYPIVGVAFHLKIQNFHRQVEKWSKRFGPVMRIHLINIVAVVVSDFDSIYEVLVTKSKECGSRPTAPRSEMLMRDTGILLTTAPDQTWKALRKASHKHLKQFGEGMSRLENIITDVAEDMFDKFKKNTGKPFDPYQVIFDTALNSIAFLITGKRTHTGDLIVEKMRRFENLAPKYILSFEVKHLIYDLFPKLRYLNLSGWQDIQSVLDIGEDIWKDIKVLSQNDPDAKSLVTTLMNHITMNSNEGKLYSELDVQKTALSLLFAGVTTTSASFYAAVNILAHEPNVQEKIHNEITDVAPGKSVSLQNRPDMPYTYAVLLELLRYVSVVSMGISHCATQDMKISGYHIPKNTEIYTNLWAMHHDDKFWSDPYRFWPERFLDDKGQLVPADHPNRKHLMPFGAGMRVCLGESLAVARLFLWLVMLVQRYSISPAENNLRSSTDPRNFDLEGVLRITRYSIILTSR